MNISLEDAIALCGLTQEEIEAIAEHEHMGDVEAAAMAANLLQSDEGIVKIAQFILEEVQNAQAGGKTAHAAALKTVLKHYIEGHL